MALKKYWKSIIKIELKIKTGPPNQPVNQPNEKQNKSLGVTNKVIFKFHFTPASCILGRMQKHEYYLYTRTEQAIEMGLWGPAVKQKGGRQAIVLPSGHTEDRNGGEEWGILRGSCFSEYQLIIIILSCTWTKLFNYGSNTTE